MESKYEVNINGETIEIERLANGKFKVPEQVKKVRGGYSGAQFKPAVEVILVVSKGKTLTWLDDCRIPYSDEKIQPTRNNKIGSNIYGGGKGFPPIPTEINQKGRFPANLLVENDVLNDGKITKSKPHLHDHKKDTLVYGNGKGLGIRKEFSQYNDSGSYSRYFSLDAWADGAGKTFPFLICPKASKVERNKGCEDLEKKDSTGVLQMRQVFSDTIWIRKNEPTGHEIGMYLKDWRDKKGLSLKDVAKHFPSVTGGLTGCVWNWEHGTNIPTKEEWLKLKEVIGFDDKYDKQMTEFIEVRRNNEFAPTQPKYNHHPTVKPLKLLSYLITLGSREGDIVLDPFVGSGTTYLAATQLNRNCVGIEINPEYIDIAKTRIKPILEQTKLL